MSIAALDDFLALNDQIAALIRADVPIDLGLGTSKSAAIDRLARINTVITRRLSMGMSLAEALEVDDAIITPAYRVAARLSLESGDLSAGLAEATRLAQTTDDAWHAVRHAGFYPLLVCGIAYLGLISFSYFLAPRLEAMYTTLQMPATSGYRLLVGLHDALPYWIGIPPLLLLLLFVWSRFRSRRMASGSRPRSWFGWVPGTSNSFFLQQCATFAESVSKLIQAGTPLDRAVQIGAGLWGIDPADVPVDRNADAAEPNQPTAEQRAAPLPLPPFLRWALWNSEPTIDRPHALQMAATLYRESARRRISRLRTVAPMLALVVIGGGITLLYGLTLFVPIVQLLKGLAS